MVSPFPAGFGPATYGRSFADVYDEWYAQVSDAQATAEFVAARLGDAQVLELGSGTGRLARSLAAVGLAVVGVDVSLDMLHRHQTVPAVGGDLAALPLRSRAFAGAVCAFNTLFNLPDTATQRRALSEAARVLVPGGLLFVEAMTGTGLDDAEPSSLGVSRIAVDRLVLSATLTDTTDQTITGQHVEIDAGGIRLRPWFVRWTTPAQLDAVATAAGLERIERYGDWDGTPFHPESPVHVSVYRS